jgi:heme/copper-type cytochrome/quinol oxidase subunit 2
MITTPFPASLSRTQHKAESIHHLSHVVLSITAVIFLAVFTLMTHAAVKFRSRAGDAGREPAQVYGGAHRLSWPGPSFRF